uniref:Uncharacterized protein LOC104246679 n=1 Tax=Nicotiana sylvestris TaxID=4096 RepID=A0A1U7Y9P8_NICSY|nr:PREDICTED: uncharacterized protein LOC104246679 [Nicotiana sylvestris]
MGAPRRMHMFVPYSAPSSPYLAKNARGFRNLMIDQLGGVVFGCTSSTMKECLENQLFGLPIEHFSYVKNVHPGLPLFLFNYNDRKIHGIFEAVSSGQMHINPYSWTSDGYEKTRYPAQVQIRVRLQCQPLPENQFKPIILDNYYSQNHFWFELDHVQSNKLISKLASLAIAPSKTLYNSANWGNIIQDLPENVMIADNGSFEPQVLENKSSSSVDVNRKFGAGDISPCSKGSVLQLESPLDFHAALDEKDFIYKKLRELVLERECSGAPTNGHVLYHVFFLALSAFVDACLVQIRVRLQCQPLPENQFKPIILDNYYSQNHFWFELDHVQSNKLISKLASLAIAPSKTLYNSANWGNIIQDLPENVMIADNGSFEPQVLENKSSSSVDVNRKFGAGDISPCSKGSVLQLESPLDFHAALDEKDFIYKKLRELVLERECNPVNDVSIGKAAFRKARLPGEEKNEESSCDSAVYPSFVVQLLQGMEELIAFNEEQHKKMGGLEQKLADIQEEIKLLKNKCLMLESSNPLRTHAGENVVDSDDVAHLNDESIILAGGYDGVSWLSAFDSYSPLNDVFKSLKPMNSVRSFFALANLSREIYVFGGRCGSLWSNGVESYNPADNKWTVHPCLNEKKGSLSGAALKDKIFAVGGGNGIESFSQVEMYDPQVGRWISTRSMWQKRFALAAAELNGALYAVGGFDGNNYLATAERFDPREHSWTKIESMSTKRGSHALVALRGKLYALGGHDGYQMVPSIEIYDPRRGTWMIGEPMNCSRGYSAAAVLKESIYVIGGVKSDNEIIDTIECYKEDQGWQTTTSRAVGKRCFSSAVVSEEC